MISMLSLTRIDWDEKIIRVIEGKRNCHFKNQNYNFFMLLEFKVVLDINENAN
jgi:hypothetical protein